MGSVEESVILSRLNFREQPFKNLVRKYLDVEEGDFG
jgi:hypothetical protein